jgi:GT2 family glycosyltransferase
MPPSPTPKISAVIPIYGNVGDLDRLIAALNGQTLKPWEIIVVDSSPKPLPKIPQGENVKYVKNPNDVALSWDYNLGLKENTGDYQLDLQQDCLPEDPQALERLFRHLDQPGRVAAVALVTLPERIYDELQFLGQGPDGALGWAGAARHQRQVRSHPQGCLPENWRLRHRQLQFRRGRHGLVSCA